MSNPDTEKDDQVETEMDAILDSALDELDDDFLDGAEEEEEQQQPPKSSAKRPAAVAVDQEQEEDNTKEEDFGALNDMMKSLMGAGGGNADEVMGAFMQELQNQVAAEMQNVNDTETSAATSSEDEPDTASSDVDRTISKLLEDMVLPPSDTDAGAVGGGLEDIMEGLEGDASADDMIDGMMAQLLSKELMYEPMKQVTDKFPKWLEEKKDSLEEEEYKSRCKQYESFQKLIIVYETEPNNVEALMTLMQEVQEFGQPPAEIVQEIAPGLQLDDSGVPMMDGAMGSSEECTIM